MVVGSSVYEGIIDLFQDSLQSIQGLPQSTRGDSTGNVAGWEQVMQLRRPKQE
jgi:hypothetical protein